MAAEYAGRVTYVSENFGASKLADRYGVKGYPAIFVDDVLVASPREFGYFGDVDGSGRYAPWRDAKSQAKFKVDLSRMISLILAGRKDVVSRETSGATAAATEISNLPKFAITDLSGNALSNEQLAGRALLVEFWATWCPPCRSTLEWLGEVKRKYGDKVAVVAFAVESPEDKIRSTVSLLSPALRWAIADLSTARAFGDITAVPTMFLFDKTGKTAKVIYGAAPDLHEQVGKILDELAR